MVKMFPVLTMYLIFPSIHQLVGRLLSSLTGFKKIIIIFFKKKDASDYQVGIYRYTYLILFKANYILWDKFFLKGNKNGIDIELGA